MNNNNGALDFDAYINDTDFKKSIYDMKARIIGLSKTAEDEGNKIDSVFKKIGAGVATYFSAQALANFGKQIVNVRGEFQQLEVAFTTMLGSKDKADQLMEQLVRTAATTPFDLKSVSGGAKQLLAYGESAETVNETLVRLGNIASGLSLPLNDLVYLYGTTMVQGRLFTQDVRQFMGRGIPLVQELSKELGVTTEEVNAMVTAGKIGFPEVQKVIERLTNEGGMFYNLMEEQSKTLSGQISNLEDAWTNMLNDIGKETQDMASDGIAFLAGLIEHYDTILKILKVLVVTYGTYKAAVITLNAVQAVQIQLANGYTIAELAKYRALLLAEKAQKLLNKTMLANPYVLAATAVVGLVTALVTFGGKASEAEKAQERLNEAEKRASETVDGEIAKIQSLVTIISSETAAQKEKEKALRDLHRLAPDHFSDLDEEAIRTGAAKGAIDDYIESLRQKVLLQEYEHELAESFKRQEAAERGENKVSWIKQAFLGLATSENNMHGAQPGIDYVAEANKELNAEIVAAEKAFQEQIKGKIEALVNGSGKAVETPATTGIKTVSDRIKEIDDQISALESKRGKLAATDAAGIAAINAEITKLNDEKKKLEGKGSSGSKDRYAGAEKESLNYYKQMKEESVKALENLSTADAKYAEKQAALLAKIAEAERKILEIEGGNGNLSEKLEYRRKQYETYEKWVAAGLKKEADQEFATLLQNGNSFVEYLDRQIAEIKSKGELSVEDSKSLVTLLEARDGATGRKSPLEIFKENLEQAKLESKNLVEYLEKVKKLEEELADDNSELGVAKKGYLAEEETSTSKSIAEETKAALQEYESYTQKRARIDAEYRYKKALIDKVNTEGQYDDNLKALEKWYNEALSSIDSEVTSKSDLWIRLFSNASQLSKASIKAVIADTKALLNYLNGATKIKPAGFTDEQLDTLGKDPEKVKAIYDALIKQQDELDSRSNYTMSGFVKGFGDLKEAADLQKKAQMETNEELKKTLLLQAEMARVKGMDEILGGIQDFGDVVSTFGSKIKELAEATGDDGLKDTAEALSGLGSIISSTAAGAAAGGWIGAIIGAVTSIGSVIFDAFTQSEKSAKQAQQDALDWARRYQLLILDLKEEDYESAFGTRAIEKAAKTYELLTKALEQYEENVNFSGFTDMYKEIASDPANIQEVGIMFWSVANAMAKVNKYSTDLENMRIRTKDYNWWQETFGGKSDEYKSLRDLAPQIWADGGFNVEAARAFLETNHQLSEEQRKQIQNVIDLYDQYEELDKALEATVKDTWGDLGTTMIDSITQAIATGEDAMTVFADKLGDRFADLGEQIAYELFFADAFDDLLKRIKATYGLGSTEAIGKAQADLIGGFFSSMSDEAAKAQSWLEQWKEYAAKYGFDIWSGDENDNEDPLTGAVQKITSEEASALAGQLTMVRIKQDQMTAYLGDQLVHLIGIRENTAKTVDRLDQILARIEGNNVINSLRSKGL